MSSTNFTLRQNWSAPAARSRSLKTKTRPPTAGGRESVWSGGPFARRPGLREKEKKFGIVGKPVLTALYDTT